MGAPAVMPMHKIKENMDKQLEACERPSTHRAADHPTSRRAMTISPAHQRRDDPAGTAPRSLVRQRSIWACRPRRRQGRREVLKAPRMPRTCRNPAAESRDDAAVTPASRFRWRDRFNLSLDPDTCRTVSRPDTAGRRRQDCAFLLDVREILLDEDASARLRREVRTFAGRGGFLAAEDAEGRHGGDDQVFKETAAKYMGAGGAGTTACSASVRPAGKC